MLPLVAMRPTLPAMNRRGPSIYEVAVQAGVAPSTVSRAFSNPGRVSVATKERVLAAARQVGYRPHALRALSGGRTRTVALLVSDVTNPHYFSVITGAERRATAAGLMLILVNTEDSPQVERRQIQQLDQSVDAFILASSRLSDEALRELGTQHTIVLVSRELDGVPSALVDFMEGPRQIVEHLASLGHNTLTYLSGPRTSWLGARRWESISAASTAAGLRPVRLGPFPATVAAGSAAADAAIRSGATAVVAHNDLLAIGVLRRLAARRVLVPHDISVVGFDDIFAAEVCSPSLTTVAGPHEDVGRLAVELLLEAASSPSSTIDRKISLPAHLVMRESSGPAFDQ